MSIGLLLILASFRKEGTTHYHHRSVKKDEILHAQVYMRAFSKSIGDAQSDPTIRPVTLSIVYSGCTDRRPMFEDASAQGDRVCGIGRNSLSESWLDEPMPF